MNEYQKLEQMQKQYEAAIQCTCVCHHLAGALTHDRPCCAASTQNIERLKESIKAQHAVIRNLING